MIALMVLIASLDDELDTYESRLDDMMLLFEVEEERRREVRREEKERERKRVVRILVWFGLVRGRCG